MRRILFLLLVLSSCSPNRNEKIYSGKVILQTLDSAINNFTYNSLDSSVLVHFEVYPELAKELPLNKMLTRNSNEFDKQELDLIRRLKNRILDSVHFQFLKPFRFKNNIILEEAYRDKIQYPDSIVFGRISLTDPEFTDNGHLSCYYLALDCPQIALDCSVGFIVFAIKSNGEWRIKKIHQLWQAGRPIEVE